MINLLPKVDRFVAGPVIMVGGVLRHLQRWRAPQKRPLVIRPGGLGDLVVATAALEYLGMIPTAVDWLIERRSEVWAEYLKLPYCCYDEVPACSPDFLRPRTRCLNSEQLYGLSAAAAWALTARSGHLLGFSTNRGARVYCTSVPYDPLNTHELTSFARLFEVGLRRRPALLLPRVRQRPCEDHTVVAIAGSASPSRRWDANRWAELIRKYVSTDRIALVAAPRDVQLAGDIERRLGRGGRILSGSWATICEVISTAQRVFTVDGGMVHVASYFGVPVDAIFTSGREPKWRPWSQDSTVIRRRDLTCQPCAMFGAVPPCPWHLQCKDEDKWVQSFIT